MANKILKTLTLPNAQGEPVTYELHPEWDNIENKNYEYIVQASFVNRGESLYAEDITLIDFNWENLIQAIQENKRVICRMTANGGSFVQEDFLFTQYSIQPPRVHFVCSGNGYIENFYIYSNGDISYSKRTTYTDSTLTEGGVPAEAKATGDAISNLNALIGETSVAEQIEAVSTELSTEIANASVIVTDVNGDGNLVFNTYIVSKISSAEGVSF